MASEEEEACSRIYYAMEELCSRANSIREEAAMKEYLKSNVHTHFRSCEAFLKTCRAEMKRLKAGKPSQIVRFACCADCFKSVLGERPGADYCCYSTEREESDAAWLSVEDPLMAPDDPEGLESFLDSNDCGLIGVSYYCDREDLRRRDQYVRALKTLVLTAAQFAKRINAEDAALDLLEGLRILSAPRPEPTGWSFPIRPVMAIEEAAAVYAALARGFARLWTRNEYAQLKAL